MYINWENEQGNLREVTAVYDRILGIPTQLYSHHFQRYVERSFLWNIFGYVGDQFPILSITVYFEMLYRILLEETNFLENKNLCLNLVIFSVSYEMFNILVLYWKLFLSILYLRYFRTVKKWDIVFYKWFFCNTKFIWYLANNKCFFYINFLR